MDTPSPSSSRSTRSTALRPSPPSTIKASPIGPSAAKPTKGELLARVEVLSRKSQSVKRKTLDSVEKDCPDWGKVPKLGASSFSLSTHARISGQVFLPPAEVPKALSCNPVPALLQRQKAPREGLLSSRWRSLLLNTELAAGAVSSILKYSDVKRSGALPVDEALALSLQGVTSVSV